MATPTSNPTSADERRASGDACDIWSVRRFALALGLALAALYPDVLTGAGTFVFRDFCLFSYPLAHFQRECFWDGDLPFWNPLNNCGIPFLAQWSGLALYPPALFYLLLPLTWALGVFCLLHVFWGGLGMFVLIQRMTGNSQAAAIGGVAFALGGFTQSCLMWHMTTACVSWFPWVTLTAMRAWRSGGARPLALAAGTGAMQMLTGPPEMILATWLPLTAIWLSELSKGDGERRFIALRFVTLIALIAALAAPQILPFFELLEHSQRSSAYDSGGWDMPGTGWANFLVPRFHAYPSPVGVWLQHDQGVLSSYFPGIAVVALAILACWRIRSLQTSALAALTAICLILALGRNTPFYELAKSVFPPLGFMRYPIKFVFPVCLILPLLAGLGAANLMKPGSPSRSWRAVVAGLIGGGVCLLAVARISVVNDVPWSQTALDGGLRVVFLISFAAAAQFALKAQADRPRTIALVTMVGVLALDLAAHAWPQNPRINRAILQPGIESIEQLKPRPTPGRARAMVSLEALRKLQDAMLSDPAQGHLLHRAALWANANMIENAPVIDGHFPLFLQHEEAVRVALYTAGEFPDGFADFLGIAHTTRQGEIFDWEARPKILPQVTAGQKPRLAAPDAIPALLVDGNFDPRSFALFETNDAETLRAIFPGQDEPTTPAPPLLSSTSVSRHRIATRITTAAPTMALIARTHHTCWQATVNGRPEPILRANGAFMAIPVRSGGEHEIVVTYKDKQFITGLGISAATLLVLVGACLVSSRNSRRSTAAAKES